MSKRVLASTTLIGVALLLSSTACVDPLGALGAYSDLLPVPGSGAWQNYDARSQAREFENGPSVAVRVINNTPAQPSYWRPQWKRATAGYGYVLWRRRYRPSLLQKRWSWPPAASRRSC